MACLQPAVLAPGGRPALICPHGPEWQSWLTSPVPHISGLFYLTFMPSSLPPRWSESWTLPAQPGCSGWLAKPHMPDFCNLFARPVFMSMLIVGSAVVQLYLLDFERLLFGVWLHSGSVWNQTSFVIFHLVLILLNAVLNCARNVQAITVVTRNRDAGCWLYFNLNIIRFWLSSNSRASTSTREYSDREK